MRIFDQPVRSAARSAEQLSGPTGRSNRRRGHGQTRATQSAGRGRVNPCDAAHPATVRLQRLCPRRTRAAADSSHQSQKVFLSFEEILQQVEKKLERQREEEQHQEKEFDQRDEEEEEKDGP